MNWNELVHALANDVDWTREDYLETQAKVVEEVLLEVHRAPALLQERTEQIAGDEALLDELLPHIDYPRTLMDKFVIYVDPLDRFRIRLHRFWPRRTSGDAIEKVHYHKWDMTTVMLTGSYIENRFDVTALDEAAGTATVEQVSAIRLEAGQVNSLAWGQPHQVVNPEMDEPAITLFVRGPSRQPFARIFDEEKGTFYNTFSPKPQIREGLLQVGRLNGVFHPVLGARA